MQSHMKDMDTKGKQRHRAVGKAWALERDRLGSKAHLAAERSRSKLLSSKMWVMIPPSQVTFNPQSEEQWGQHIQSPQFSAWHVVGRYSVCSAYLIPRQPYRLKDVSSGVLARAHSLGS